MNTELYQLYKRRYFQILKRFEKDSKNNDLALELTNIEFDDIHRKIIYSGRHIDKITPFFAKTALTIK